MIYVYIVGAFESEPNCLHELQAKKLVTFVDCVAFRVDNLAKRKIRMQTKSNYMEYSKRFAIIPIQCLYTGNAKNSVSVS